MKLLHNKITQKKRKKQLIFTRGTQIQIFVLSYVA